MIVSINQPQPIERKTAVPKIREYTGEVVYIYAFDVAYEMTRQAGAGIAGPAGGAIRGGRQQTQPASLFFYRPQMVRLPPLERIGPQRAGAH